MKYLYTVLIISLITGCAGGSLKPTVPDSGDARSTCPVQEAVVLDLVNVTIERNVEAAQAGGAALGGYIGNRALKNESELEQVLGTVVGTAAGSAVGNAVGTRALNRDGVELILQVNGSAVSVVQELDPDVTFYKGDTVWVIGNVGNRYGRCSSGTRVLPKGK